MFTRDERNRGQDVHCELYGSGAVVVGREVALEHRKRDQADELLLAVRAVADVAEDADAALVHLRAVLLRHEGGV